jgi:hypothetical protein
LSVVLIALMHFCNAARRRTSLHQGELLRDNLETVVGYARKAREHSARLADEAERRESPAHD